MSEEKRNEAPSNKGADQNKSAASASTSASASSGASKSAASKPADKTTAGQSGKKQAASGANTSGGSAKTDASSSNAAKGNTAGAGKTGASATNPGATTAASTAAAKPTGSGASTPNRPARGAHSGNGGGKPPIIAIVAVVIALIALVISGWLLYRGEQRLASADSRLDTVEKSVQSSVQDIVMPRLSRFDSRLQSLDADLGDLGSRIDRQGQNLSDMQASLEATQTQLAELADARNESASRLQLDQIESLLRVANQRVQLYDDPQGAARALEMASDAIARKNDPRLFDIRGEIANEVAALQALPSPDIEGLSLQLAALIEQVPQLPLDSSVPSEYDNQQSQAKAADDESSMSFDEFQSQFSQGWDHFKNSVGDALSGMMTIRRSDGTQRALLPPDQAFFLNQNLQLELRSARLALLERDTENYRESLETAREWLADYYDSDAAPVSQMRDRLNQMSNVKLDWDTPDISRSLVLLEQLKSRRGGGSSGSNDSSSNQDNDASAGEQTGQDGA
ncbi:uroporphyrinogen-III C-methyltransferase [uncultured Salinisphaera sp.]|uniref:uroporphyrinogen-III C-methyltransferase n=1 Tax=uncultured Salinisphaera sp. TaxID=359372 RepID=UPI0032B10934